MMATNKVFIGTRFDSDRVKTLEQIAKKLHISRNAVIENAFDIYAEEVLGVNTSDNTIQILEDRIKALESTIAELQPQVLTPSDNTIEPKVLTPSDNTIEPKVLTPKAPLVLTLVDGIQPTSNARLSKKEFCKQFGLASPAYLLAFADGKTSDGCLDQNGDRWFVKVTKEGVLWTKAAVSSDAEATS